MFVILNEVKDPLFAGAKMNSRISKLAEKIQTLHPAQIAEVEDFIEFLRTRTVERGISHNAATASNRAFEAVWDNPEDAVYDAL